MSKCRRVKAFFLFGKSVSFRGIPPSFVCLPARPVRPTVNPKVKKKSKAVAIYIWYRQSRVFGRFFFLPFACCANFGRSCTVLAESGDGGTRWINFPSHPHSLVFPSLWKALLPPSSRQSPPSSRGRQEKGVKRFKSASNLDTFACFCFFLVWGPFLLTTRTSTVQNWRPGFCCFKPLNGLRAAQKTTFSFVLIFCNLLRGTVSLGKKWRDFVCKYWARKTAGRIWIGRKEILSRYTRLFVKVTRLKRVIIWINVNLRLKGKET